MTSCKKKKEVKKGLGQHNQESGVFLMVARSFGRVLSREDMTCFVI